MTVDGGTESFGWATALDVEERQHRASLIGVLMTVPMMQVGVVRVTVDTRFVPMPMTVRLARRIAWRMSMLMVLVVGMTMLMPHHFVPMFMLVAFGQV